MALERVTGVLNFRPPVDFDYPCKVPGCPGRLQPCWSCDGVAAVCAKCETEHVFARGDDDAALWQRAAVAPDLFSRARGKPPRWRVWVDRGNRLHIDASGVYPESESSALSTCLGAASDFAARRQIRTRGLCRWVFADNACAWVDAQARRHIVEITPVSPRKAVCCTACGVVKSKGWHRLAKNPYLYPYRMRTRWRDVRFCARCVDGAGEAQNIISIG